MRSVRGPRRRSRGGTTTRSELDSRNWGVGVGGFGSNGEGMGRIGEKLGCWF